MSDFVKPGAVADEYRERRRGRWMGVSLHRPGLDVLTVVCGLMVLLHLWVEVSGGVVEHRVLYDEWLGLKVEGVISGKFWQLVSYGFLHGGWWHLMSNVVMIWLIGGRLMDIVGQRMLGIGLFMGSLVGGLFFMLFDLWSGGGVLLVGGSGSAVALFILMACLSPNARMFPLRLRARSLAVGVMLGSLILCVVHPGVDLPFFGGVIDWLWGGEVASIFRVAHSCHLGGGLAGYLISRRVLGKLISLEDLRRARLD